MKLDVAVRRYLDALRVGGASALTVRQRKSGLGRFVRWAGDRSLSTLASVSKVHLQAYQRHLFHQRTPSGTPLGRPTQLQLMSAVRGLYRWAAKESHIAINPAAGIELPKLEQRLPKDVFRPDEVAQVLDAIDLDVKLGRRDRALLEVAYSTGLRRAELAALDLFDVDFERGLVRVQRGKGGKGRLVPVGDRALNWVERYLEAREALPDEEALFVGQRGHRLCPEQVGRIARSRVVKAGLTKPGAMHAFRHAMATAMLDNGANLRHVQEMLGHADIAATQVYTRVSVGKLKEVHQRAHPAEKKRGPAT